MKKAIKRTVAIIFDVSMLALVIIMFLMMAGIIPGEDETVKHVFVGVGLTAAVSGMLHRKLFYHYPESI